ncbi:MFS transporter [Anthocerotibacter panamensis]|uniref:MFS transporter n=1 Tax=Anthocerotibacter panamensis TaxID=2857077 RepID=UPI001C403D43|nr:MFS transporter [Anthocerotibacter panamensis]
MRSVEPLTPIPKTHHPSLGATLFNHLGALKYRDYRLFWFSAFISNVGSWIQVVAQGWLVLQLSNSPFWLGVVGFAGGLPALFFSLLGGILADRFDRRTLLVTTQAVQMAMALLLGWLTATGGVTILGVAVLAFSSGLAMALSGPAYQTMARDLAGDEFTSAIALNSTQFNLARVLGPSLAAILLATLGAADCFYINGVSYLAVIGTLFLLRLPRQPLPSGMSFRCSLLEAFRYVRETPAVQYLLLIVAVSSMFAMPYLNFLPIFAQDILKAGPTGLGWMTGAVGVGAVVGSLVIADQGERLGKGRILFIGSLGLALSLTGFALSTNFFLSLGLLMGMGASIVGQVTIVNTLLQSMVPDQLRGRVLSMFSLAFMGVLPLGNLLSGFVAEYIGVALTLALGAGLVGIYALTAFGRHPEMLKY